MTTGARGRDRPFAWGGESLASLRNGREFPTVGSHDAPVSRVATAQFFATGPFARTPEWSSAKRIASIHAKEVGASTTVCGLPTWSWSVLWEVPFSADRLQGACPGMSDAR